MLHDAASYLTRSPNANLAEIATACGVSRATLHRYFPGRQALIDALLERADRSLAEATARADLTSGDHVEALRRLIDEFAACAPFSTLLYTISKEGEDADSDAWDDADEMIIAFFESGQRARRFAPNFTAAWMTEALYSLITAGEWAVLSGRMARRDSAKQIHEIFLHGISSDDSA
jgi:AcrR family transcriptional regulator